MNSDKIVRTVCFFTDDPRIETVKRIDQIADKLTRIGYTIQTKRICSTLQQLDKMEKLSKYASKNGETMFSVGTVDFGSVPKFLDRFYKSDSLFFNIDLTSELVGHRYVDLLYDIIRNKPQNTFNFTFVFNNSRSTPYFPSASYTANGFSVGLQSTDLSYGCKNLDGWFESMHLAWNEIDKLLRTEKDYLGIDSSIAPNLSDKSSFIGIARKLHGSFSHSVLTDMYVKTSRFIKDHNPKPIGLCGMMFPCLEDAALAEEYEKGEFTVERNIYLSLHSGLGIDTYPIGVDENPIRVLEILQLIHGLSNKYGKPLSVRFVSDGKAGIGDRTDFKNSYLRDVVIRKL